MVEPVVTRVYERSTDVCYISCDTKSVTLSVPWLDGYQYYTVEPTTVRKEELNSTISYIRDKFPDVVIITTEDGIAKEYGVELLKASISYIF